MLFWRVLLTSALVAMSVAGTVSQERQKPDYDRVFSMDRVHELRITIPAERFRAMQADLAGLGRGRAGRALGPGFAPMPPPVGPVPEAAPFQGPLPMFAAGRGPALSLPEPMSVRVSVHASGRTWTNVRMRYKGNSSLMAATTTGDGKVPFRLEFASNDHAGASQGFHGFRKLTFSSNFADQSQLREVLATEVLRDRGVPAARAAFYRVFVDTGEGPKYWGLYTMVEDPADGAMLDAQLGGRGANLYKPDGPAASWTRFDPASFEKKTNERASDFSDVIAAIDALHSGVNDRRAWRAGIERVFDVDLFLRWLAVNTAIGNWDAYGAMPHNYYLYGDPARGGRLRWIPWDHNMAFGAGPGFGRGFPGRGAPPDAPPPLARGPGRGRGGPFGRATDDVLHRDVGAEWPLISRLLSDPDYSARYRAFLGDAVAGLMAPDVVARRIRTLHDLIAPAVEPDDTFRDSPASLLGEITRQRERIHAALAESAR
jgi:spore coat protein H